MWQKQILLQTPVSKQVESSFHRCVSITYFTKTNVLQTHIISQRNGSDKNEHSVTIYSHFSCLLKPIWYFFLLLNTKDIKKTVKAALFYTTKSFKERFLKNNLNFSLFSIRMASENSKEIIWSHFIVLFRAWSLQSPFTFIIWKRAARTIY